MDFGGSICVRFAVPSPCKRGRCLGGLLVNIELMQNHWRLFNPEVFSCSRIRQEESRTSEGMKLARELYKSQNSTELEFELRTWPTGTYIYVYSGIIVALFVFTLLRSVAIFEFCVSASKNLHEIMFRGLISTKLRFFDMNPSGRIMNRFSKDMGSADEALPKSFLDAVQYNLTVFGAMFVIVFTNLKFSIVVLILGIVFLLILNIYLKCSTNIKRLEGRSE